MVIAIQLTNASSVRGFETALDTVSGRASVEITAPGGVDETLLPALGWLREFGAGLAGDRRRDGAGDRRGWHGVPRPRRTEAVKVLGVDILRDRTMRDYAVAATAVTAATSADGGMAVPTGGRRSPSQQFLTLLTSPQSVVITEKLARRRGYALGDEIRLMTGDRVGHLRRPRAARGHRAGAGDGRQLRADGHRRGAAGLRPPRPHRPRRRADCARTHRPRCLADTDQRRHRRRGRGHRRPAAGRAHRRPAVPPRPAGGADARRVPPEPVGAVVGGARRRACSWSTTPPR